MNPMNLLRTLALSWLAVVSVGTARAQPAALPSIESFFEEPVLGGAQLSPDGRTLAMRVGAKDLRARLGVLDLQTIKSAVVAQFADSDVDSFSWAGNHRLVLNLMWDVVGPGRAERGPGLFAVDRDGRSLRTLVDASGQTTLSQASASRLLPWYTTLLRTMASDSGDDVLVVVAAVAAVQPQEAVGQDAALEEGVELVLNKLRQIRSCGSLSLGEEGRGVLLHQAVKRGLFRAVALVVDRGAIRRPLGLLHRGLHARLPKW